MTPPISDLASGKVARTAGLMFLLSLFVPMFNWILINGKFVVEGNPTETVRRVLADPQLFRVGLANDFLTSVIALVLASTLYLMLVSIHKTWAQVALALKVTEGVLLAVIALGNFSALLLVDNHVALGGAEAGPAQMLVGQFLNARMTLAAIPMLFLGLNFTVFLSLLYQSKYVPGLLAGFGVVAYALILVYALLTLLFPSVAANLVLQSLAWTPSCVFELVIGVWLLMKGIRPEPPRALSRLEETQQR
jgi:Domain of unknown function (DUF4386)